jgi:hypothetical protein
MSRRSAGHQLGLNAKIFGIKFPWRNRMGRVVNLQHKSGFNVFENIQDLF